MSVTLEKKTFREMPIPRPPETASRRKRGIRPWIVLAFVLGGIGALVAGRKQIVAAISSDEGGSVAYQTQKVSRGNLRITVTEDGNVESASNVEVKCQVEGGSQILWIIPEGTQVKKGALLVRLNSATIEEQITTQKIAFEKARSAFIKAEEDFAAKTIAVKEYLEGTFVKDLQTADSNIVIAKENLKSAQNNVEHSERMFRKGYINQLQLEQNRFAVQRAQLDLDTFLTARKVLVDYTREKTKKELESARDAAQADLLAQKAACELEKTKLDRLEEQRKRCEITAPQDGMVIYANDRNMFRGGGAGSSIVEEGAQVREFQTLIRLPDLSQMQVKVLVHETKVEDIRPGMSCRVAIRDRSLRGTVVSVSSQPEASNWFSAQVKEYATIVKIDDTAAAEGIKPGMTAEVEILIAELPNVLVVPLTGVVEHDGKFVCYVKAAGNKVTARPVVVGKSNDKFLEIKDGLTEGEEVVLNPRATVPEARDIAHAKSLSRQADTKESPAIEGAAKKGAAPETSTEKAEPKRSGEPLAGAAPKGAAETPGDRPSAGKGKKSGKRSFDLLSYDKNKDGKISLDESPEQMKPMFSRLDLNSDGFIDSKEISELRKRMQRAGAGAGGPPGAGPPSGGGQ